MGAVLGPQEVNQGGHCWQAFACPLPAVLSTEMLPETAWGSYHHLLQELLSHLGWLQ